MNQSYILYQIKSFSLKSLLEKEGVSDTIVNNTTWMHYDLLTRIIEKTHTTKFKTSSSYNKGWVNLNSTKMKALYGQEVINGKRTDRYFIIRERLKRWGLILFYTEQLAETERRARYKLLDELLEENGAVHWNHADDSVKAPKTLGVTLDTSTCIDMLSPVLQHVRRDLDRVTISSEVTDFIEWARANKLLLRPKRNAQYKLIRIRKLTNTIEHHWNYHLLKIQLRQWGLHPQHPSTNRIYTILHTLAAELRPYLRIDGRELVEVDVANCQPLLFAVLLRRYFSKLPADAKLWVKECENGNIYDYLIKLLKKEGIDIITSNHADKIKEQKSEFKIEFFKKIFFSTENINYKWREIFTKYFPSVGECITELKKEHGHSYVSVELQRIEAELILDTVTKRLYDTDVSGFFTLHDSFLTLPENVDTIKQHLIEAFANLNLKCVTKNKLISK